MYVKSASVRKDACGYTVDAVLYNAGKADTQDVAQVYCQNEGSENAPLNPRLIAFKRACVPAGQEAAVSIPLNEESFKVVNEDGNRVSEGKIVLYVGMGQPDERTKELTRHEAVKLTLDV